MTLAATLAAAAAACLLGAAAAAPAAGGLGPGLGPWQREDPSAHGLSAANLKLAGERLAQMTPVRDCFVVVRDGVVVAESYRQGKDNESLIIIDSIGKTMTALIVGHAVQLGLLDIDKPLASYIKPIKGVNWSTWWPTVTTRHLLSQTSGQGRYPPGTAFTYDSDQYIGHLSPLLRKVSGQTPRAFAAGFTAKMGLPHLYDYEVSPPNANPPDLFTIGGGQPMTCVDIARIGQLIINKGKWSSAPSAAAPEQLVSAEWAHAMSAASMPHVASSYGFLTYNNKPPPSLPNCCSPRWSEPPWTGCPGYADGHNRNMKKGAYLGDDLVSSGNGQLVPFAPEDIAISVGNMAKYLFTIPSREMVVVSMGQTWGSSSVCNVNLFPNYDEAMTGTVMWEAFGDLTMPHESIAHAAEVQQVERVEEQQGQQEDFLETLRAAAGESAPSSAGDGSGGACYCYCPPDRTDGRCYNLTKSSPDAATRRPSGADQCRQFVKKGSEPGVCPGIGVVKECGGVGAEDCSTK